MIDIACDAYNAPYIESTTEPEGAYIHWKFFQAQTELASTLNDDGMATAGGLLNVFIDAQNGSNS